MGRRNTLIFMGILIIFTLAALVVFPIDQGALGKKGIRLGLDLQGGVHIVYKADLSLVPGEEKSAIGDVVKVLEKRINPLGVTEPVIQTQGSDRILVELPGRTITDKEKENLSRVALLEFGELTTENETAKWTDEQGGKWKPATGVIDGEEKALSSQYFKSNTYVAPGQKGGVEIVFEWDKEGSLLSEQITGRLLGKSLGIFEEDRLLSAPTVEATITQRGIITGMKPDEAKELSQLLNAGRLRVPLEIIYNQSVSPILGSDFVDKSIKAGLIGIATVILFMIIYYRVPGVLASLALIFYAMMNMAVFKLMPVTLTLAGLAGFIVSLGMAVDANVLIFERMKEELIAGRTLGGAIEAGFKRAWSAIWDSNLTTIIACIILIWLGGIFSPAVKGFGWTLLIGVVVSMFSAVLVTRTLLRLFVGGSLAQRTWLFSPHIGGKER